MVTHKNAEHTVVDLFAGAGLLSYAFSRVGFRVTRAVELDAVACETYRRNLGEHVEVANVRNVQPCGKIDLLIGGPPCQGFSTLGKRDSRDPRNFLSLEIVRWAKAMQPKCIVIENVAAFIESLVWKEVAVKLRRLGYEVSAQLLNAADFGVPQLRVRSFTFASKIGLPHVSSTNRARSTVRQAWRGLPPEPTGDNNHYAPKPSSLALARMRMIPRGGDKRDIMRQAPDLVPKSWWRIPGDVTDVWGRMAWDAPCNTLRTALQNPSKGRYIHPEQNRVISLREAARLHTIPDDYIFVGYPTQIARQIGNAVPPQLGLAVARATLELFR